MMYAVVAVLLAAVCRSVVPLSVPRVSAWVTVANGWPATEGSNEFNQLFSLLIRDVGLSTAPRSCLLALGRPIGRNRTS
jgi:hypothetical protein